MAPKCYHPHTMTIDATATRDYVGRVWDESIVPALTEYIRIPAKSPHFDAAWREHGHLDRAVSLLEDWSVKRAIEGLTLEVARLPGRTPVILINVPGAAALPGTCSRWGPAGSCAVCLSTWAWSRPCTRWSFSKSCANITGSKTTSC